MKPLHFATWLAIWLLLTLPVAFSQQLLTIQKFAGRDNVPNFAKENDELTIQVLAQMIGNPTPEVAVQRVRVEHSDTYAFMDSCTPQPNAMYQCTYKTTDLVYSGTDDYVIKLYNDAGDEIASVTKTLTVDFLGPRVITLSLTPNMSSAPVPTTVTYKTEDYGSTTGQTTECSGVKTVNITANNAAAGQASASVGTCVKEGAITFTPTVSGPSSRVTVCAVATDHLNHKSGPMCRDILIDSQKPTAQELELRDSNGYALTHARTGQAIAADVFVRIPDVDVNPALVYADLSKLNPGLGNVVRDDQSDDWFIWRNVPITTPNTCQVTVEATDFLGNKDTKTLQCRIGVDDTSPEPLSIGTRFVDEDGTPILGVGGTIIVEFKEAGSGMDTANAILDLRGLGKGLDVKADKCDKTGADGWKCSWTVTPTVSSGDYLVKIQPTSRDDLNNQVTTTLQKTIRFDKTAPADVRLKEIAAFRGQERVKTNYTSLGETIEFVVTGAGFTTAIADLTSLGGDKETPAEHCEGNLTKNCTFAVTVAVSGPQGTNITFTLSDAAGNKATISTSALFILGISNETAPNYWNITTECSPTLLDRKTLSVFEHPVYCRVRMHSTNSQAKPITVLGPEDFFSDCTGDMDYISDMRVENNYAGSTEPYLVLSLVATDYAIDNLTFTCPMSTLTRVGNFIPQNFERDNATVNLQFYNLPLGELAQNIGDEVDDVEDSIKGVWKTIGTLQKFMAYAEKLCQILNVVMTTIATLSNILFILGISAKIGDAIDLGIGNAYSANIKAQSKGMCVATDSMYDNFNEGLLGTLKKFCNFLTCQSSLFDALGDVGLVDKPTGTGYSNFVSDWASGFGLSESIGLSGSTAIIAGKETTIQNPNSYLNVKESLVYSIAIPPLCLPGIIYNLDKWRQIQCRYGLCVLQDVKDNGLPLSVCKDQKSYMQCRFVVGEIFNLIPFAPIVTFYLNIIKQALSDPLVLVSMGFAFIANCKAACATGYGDIYHICKFLAITSQLGQTIQAIKSFKTLADFGEISGQWCEEFEEALDDYESEQEGGGG